MRAGALHQPVLAAGTVEGQWLVYCDACSSDVGDYVSKCKEAREKWPARALYEDEPPQGWTFHGGGWDGSAEVAHTCRAEVPLDWDQPLMELLRAIRQHRCEPTGDRACLSCGALLPLVNDGACDTCRPMMEKDAET